MKIKQFIFDRTKKYDELSSSDLGIYGNRERPVEPDNDNRKEGKFIKMHCDSMKEKQNAKKRIINF